MWGSGVCEGVRTPSPEELREPADPGVGGILVVDESPTVAGRNGCPPPGGIRGGGPIPARMAFMSACGEESRLSL